MSEAVQKLLAMDTWAIVGLSNDQTRAAYGVAKFLQDKGKRIVPVHPSAPVVHGEQGYTTLTEIPFEIDVVDCFVRSLLIGPVVDDAIRAGAKGIWMQLGVIERAAGRRAADAGLIVVMDRCPKIDWPGYGPP
ncbi:MAG: CoA-binding protein [Frankiaceae bacterium]|nr:CoA-binding protein [Frankiaceae bacterium]